MKTIIDFIIKQDLELHEFPTLVKPLSENFNIRTRDENQQNINPAESLVNTVIEWEQDINSLDTLEKRLNDKFYLVK